MSVKTDDLMKRLLNCLKKSEDYKAELDLRDAAWIDSLEELSEMEDAFEVDKRNKLHGKTILDIGTDCVKPLYIALKFEPDKIIGISEDLPNFASDLNQKSELFTKTKIKLINCSLFDDQNLGKIWRGKEDRFDFVLVSKTLHHLRTGECCVAKGRDKKHKECPEDEESCIYEFEGQKTFEKLLQLGKRVIIYECFFPHDKDDDKVRGRGGYFTIKEWRRILSHLSENYRVEFIEPLRCHLDKQRLDNVIAKLRQVDCACFYVE